MTLPKDTTRRIREALAKSADTSDEAGVWPFSFRPGEKTRKAVEQHDFEYVLHDAGLSDSTRREVDENFRKNLLFRKNTQIVTYTLFGLASLLGGLFW